MVGLCFDPMNLVIIFGPPAVGKMTVGLALEKLTGMKLFHNHATIELIRPFFDFGTPSFHRLVGELRIRIFEEVAKSALPGLIFTYVWALDHANDRKFIDETSAIFLRVGAAVSFAELEAPQSERLRRNETDLRLSQKPSKRDLAASKQNLLFADEKYRLNTNGDFFYPDRHLKLDNSSMPPEIAARRIQERFNLPLAGSC
jgi:hypothetical protein